MVYEPRKYRSLYKEKDLHHFQVVVEETDLDIGIKKEQYTSDLHKKVELFVAEQRQILKQYIKKNPAFLTTLEPWNLRKGKVPYAVRAMCEASRLAGVGPMATVAGFFAEQVGLFLTRFSEDVLVENGGDIWLQSSRKRKVSIYAGPSPFSQRIGIEIDPPRTPLGICTSSGTVGHSLSLGRADAVVVLATSAVLADAVATASCNLVQESKDLAKAVEWGLAIPGIQGVVAILDEQMAVQGDVKLIPVE
ncbi:MAG: UPF0280 family protein [Clostridia bacterium]|nr:UPF0280 family protein [Clostridia bacterium]